MHLPRRVLSILGLLSLLTSAHGGWEPSRMAPPWCEQLLRAQRNASCSTPFTDIAASHTVPLNLDRDEYLVAVAKASTRLKAPPPVWMSGQGQDWWVWYNHARLLRKHGTYVDLAANDAIWRSNTFFLDVCLGWRGLLIEPNRVHHARYAQHRSGLLVPVCVSNSTKNVSFAFGLGWHGGSSRVIQSTDRRRGGTVKTIVCRPLGKILADFVVQHVDFLSLDIEGHEVEALSSFDFSSDNNVKIDIIVSENETVSYTHLTLPTKRIV